MQVKPLRPDLIKYLRKRALIKKFQKQLKIFITNPRHPSLHTKVLEPKHLRLYSFRIDRKFRAIFILTEPSEVEIVDINDHYR